MSDVTGSKPPGLSVFFPAYNDSGTIASMVIRAVQAAEALTPDYEVIVVNDGSADATAEIADELARTYPHVRVVHHPNNRGYGGALQTGFRSATKDWIFYTDGDAQYDPAEMAELWSHMTADADMVNGYKISRSDPLHRIIIGRLYHHIVSLMFGLTVRDVDCDFRLMRRSIFDRIQLRKTSGVICLEMMKKIEDAGFRIVEVPVHHYHRAFGKSQFFNFRRIFKTGIDVLRLWVTLVILRQHRRGSERAEHSRRGRAGSELASNVTVSYREFYRGRRVMITGGLGFIGSNLARQLVALGADVLLVDSLIPDYGGNLFNIDGIADRVRVNVADVRQQSTMNYLVKDREVIFNLAGQVSHIDSMRDPYADLEINCRSQLTILEACRYNNPGVKVVFAGTRQVYGRPDSLPVTENHLVRPTDVNGINKAAGEYYHLVYNNVFGVRACSLRLTNVYGPRQLIRHNRQGFIGWFIRLAIEGRTIQIYGDGSQRRDFVFVDDAADAFLRAGASDACNGEVFNVGGDQPITHRDLTTLLVDIAGSGRVEYVEWPTEKKAIDIGDFYADSSSSPRPRAGRRP